MTHTTLQMNYYSADIELWDNIRILTHVDKRIPKCNPVVLHELRRHGNEMVDLIKFIVRR